MRNRRRRAALRNRKLKNVFPISDLDFLLDLFLPTGRNSGRCFGQPIHLSLNVGDRSMELNLVGWREGSQDFERSAQRAIAVARAVTSERIKNGRGHTGGEDNDWYAEPIMPAMEPRAALIVGKLFVACAFKPAG